MNILSKIKRIIVFASDVVLVGFAYYFAYLLRFNFAIPVVFLYKLKDTLMIIIILRLASFYFLGLYGGILRYASITDLVKLFKAITLSSFLFITYLNFIEGLGNFPRSVIVIDWFVVIVLVGGSRFIYRLFREFSVTQYKEGKHIVIIGAGDAGEILVREIRQNPHINYHIVGFLDDDKKRKEGGYTISLFSGLSTAFRK
jgi:FlaA1/EpsC-like NDP-sugar epimerase